MKNINKQTDSMENKIEKENLNLNQKVKTKL